MSARFIISALLLGMVISGAAEEPFHKSELIFEPEHWHVHASCIVEAPNGDLLVCWFHGSGERSSDDVKIQGARKRKGDEQWSARFTMADTPDYPDTNCAMFVDPQGRLWLLYPTILANLWESALMKYRISSDYLGDGPPRWSTSEILHITPGTNFVEEVDKWAAKAEKDLNSGKIEASRDRAAAYLADVRRQAHDKLTRRLGWMTRAHPFVLDNERLIVPLYSDGFSFSLMAYTDDWGGTWKLSNPLCGAGNIQPSIVQRRDGSLYTLMRDNGPAPKRLMQSSSKDRGATWSEVTDSDLPNPGSGAEIVRLKNGNWALISNDTERNRGSLAVQISDDEGKTWKWKRHLELDKESAGRERYHYPSLIQARDGSLHATYSHHVDRPGQPAAKSIKHAHFNEAWVKQGNTSTNTAMITFPLWPDGAPGALGKEAKDIPTLTVYPAAEGTATGAAMVICPGGGYGGLAGHEGKDYAEWLASKGVSCFVLKYRLGSGGYKHPRMLEDAARALRTVRARAAEWKVDPARVGIMGSSAGGHLASTLLTHFDLGKPDSEDAIEKQSSRPSLGILCYPVITLGGKTHQGSKRNLLGENPPQELVDLLSNEKQVTKDTPPTFLWHTMEDTAVPAENSMMFAEALQGSNVPYELHIYEKGRHGIGLANGHPWTEQCLRWLKLHEFVK